MGKNKKKQVVKEAKEKQRHEEAVRADAEAEARVQELEAPEFTPEEKAQKYRDMQLEIFNNFVRDFQEEEQSLSLEINMADKMKDFEKREREEMKKLENGK